MASHICAPKANYAIAEDHELDGTGADRVEVEGIGQFVAINIDR
jgi:hypothetical protein